MDNVYYHYPDYYHPDSPFDSPRYRDINCSQYISQVLWDQLDSTVWKSSSAMNLEDVGVLYFLRLQYLNIYIRQIMGLNSFHLRTRWYMSDPTCCAEQEDEDTDEIPCRYAPMSPSYAPSDRASSRPGSGIKRSKDRKKKHPRVEPAQIPEVDEVKCFM